jgi:pSer/pThr/pTyr-binding forkhead associated (FHA) protein
MQTVPEPAHPVPPTDPPALPSNETVYITAIPDRPTAVCAVLVGIGGPLEGEVYKIRDGANRLGRGDDCDVVLESTRISRYHAQIHHDDGAFVIEANAEVMENNPTAVNDSEIDAEGLFDGDILKLGDSSFAFRTIPKRNAGQRPVH